MATNTANGFNPRFTPYYQIILQGKGSWNSAAERDQLIQRLITSFRLSVQAAGDLLDQAAAIVMKNLPWDQARAKQQDLERLGLKSSILPMGRSHLAIEALQAPPAHRYRLVAQGKTAWQTHQAKHILAQKLVMTYKIRPLAALELLDSDAFIVASATSWEEAQAQAQRLQALGLPVQILEIPPPLAPLSEAWPWERIIVMGSWLFLTTASLLGLCYQIPQVMNVAIVRPQKVRSWDYQNRLKRYRELRDVRWRSAFRQMRLTLVPQLSLNEKAALTIRNQSRLRAGILLRIREQGRQTRAFFTLVAPGQTRREAWKFVSAGPKTIQVLFNNSQRLAVPLRTLVTLPPVLNPLPLPKGLELSANPSDWKIVVNIYWDPPHQWQYSSIRFRDMELQRFLISSGAWGKATPPGDYKIVNHMWVAVSTIYHTPMPFWNGLSSPLWGSGSFGLHALPGSGYIYALGSPASHGCVRHSPSAAHWIYNHVPLETPVTILSRREYLAPEASPQTNHRRRRRN